MRAYDIMLKVSPYISESLSNYMLFNLFSFMTIVSNGTYQNYN